MNKTPLYDLHVAMGARMVDFHGWAMPVHYGSQVEEHHYVRRNAGMFDISHMAIVDLRGASTRDFLRYLVANNVDRLKHRGKALYTCMLNERGGVIDDLIIYYLDEEWFRLVVNSATREQDLAWIRKQAEPFAVSVEERPELAMLAVQGPNARARVLEQIGARAAAAEALAPFNAYAEDGFFIARTGYTGEDGYELILPPAEAVELWQKLHQAGVQPIGLGARDTLRLEAGLNLYGTDMDETTTPLESGLEWTVAWEPAERDFIGRQALEEQRRAGPPWKLVGLILNDKGVLRGDQQVIVEGNEYGKITSGSYSPTLGKAIALARVPAHVGQTCKVDIRGKLLTATVVKPPFVRHGKPLHS